jgi:hypothetical protein
VFKTKSKYRQKEVNLACTAVIFDLKKSCIIFFLNEFLCKNELNVIIINTTYDDALESTHDTSDFQETRKGQWEITFIIRKAFNIFESILTIIIALVNTVQVNWILQEV